MNRSVLVSLLAGLVACSWTSKPEQDGDSASGRRVTLDPSPATADAGVEPDEPDIKRSELVGVWRLALDSPGGPIPVTMEIFPAGHVPAASFHNGSERAPVSRIDIRGSSVTMQVAPFDASLTARADSSRTVLLGRWRKTVPGGESKLDFHAVKGASHRFDREPIERPNAPKTIAGTWAVEFDGGDGRVPGVGEFQQEGSRLTGTFLTPEGDYRYLEGDYAGGRLRLSAFDGAHGFLFVATVEPDGTMIGDVWEADGFHAKWTARRGGRATAEEWLPDPFDGVKVKTSDGRLNFEFPNLVGKPVSLSDPRYRGKVVVLSIFGTWCPNCNDEAPLLAEWYRRYRDRGLEILGLAFEHTGDSRRDREVLREYKKRYGIEFPLLVAGTSDKQSASMALADLSELKAFPTTIFLDRRGKVRRIHSGFAGPGTGAHYKRLIRQFEYTVERLLEEPEPGRR